MLSKPAGIPEDAVQTADWKIPSGATHYVGPLPTSGEYNGDDNWDYPDVQFYKVCQACGDPSKQAFCPWSSYKLLFMYSERQPPNLLPLPKEVVESHHITSSYFAVVNGVLRRFQLSQDPARAPHDSIVLKDFLHRQVWDNCLTTAGVLLDDSQMALPSGSIWDQQHLMDMVVFYLREGDLVMASALLYALADRNRLLEEPPAAPNPPHPWAKEIKAWADGHTIQLRIKAKNPFRDEDNPAEFNYSAWTDQKNPGWWYQQGVTEYRVKPTGGSDVQ